MRETSADDLLLGLHQQHASLPTNHCLVHYSTALSIWNHMAAPEYLLVTCYTHAFHSWLAADEVCALLLRGFELDLLSQNVPSPSRNCSINPVRSYLQCLCADSTATVNSSARRGTADQPVHKQYLSLLEKCVSLLESWSASSLPMSEKPLSLALCSVLGQTLTRGYAM